MSKNKNKYHETKDQKESVGSISEDQLAAALEDADKWDSREYGAEEAFVVVAQEEPTDRLWNIHDAARQMIKNYNERWWASIEAYAKNQALGEEAPESACRSCFLKWGADLK